MNVFKKPLIIFSSVVAIDYLISKFNTKPKVFYLNKLPKNFNAQSIPPFGIFVSKKEKDNQILLNHEKHHWKEYNKRGAILFYLKYFYQYLFYGYDKMPLEIEARKEVKETKFCQENYTECVRTNKAITVQNDKFRQI